MNHWLHSISHLAAGPHRVRQHGRVLLNANRHSAGRNRSTQTIGFIKIFCVLPHEPVIDLPWRVLLPYVTLISRVSSERWHTASSSKNKERKKETKERKKTERKVWEACYYFCFIIEDINHFKRSNKSTGGFFHCFGSTGKYLPWFKKWLQKMNYSSDIFNTQTK